MHSCSWAGGVQYENWGNWFARFHDAIERQVARMMGEVYLGRGTVRTQDYTGHHHYSRSHIPPDITVADYDGRGSTLVVEVSVFRPTCGAHLPVAAGDPPGGAIRDMERRKGHTMGRWPLGSGGAPSC